MKLLAVSALLLCFSAIAAAQERRFKVSVRVCTFEGVTPVCKTLRDAWVKPNESINTQGYLPAGTRCIMTDVRSAKSGEVSYLLMCIVNGIEVHGSDWQIVVNSEKTRVGISAE